MVARILSNTPPWVFGLFAGLVMLGLMQARTRRVGKAAALALPAGMVALSLAGIHSSFGFAAGPLRLAYEDLRRLRPYVILLEMVVTGEGGPLADTRGVGPTMEALAGMTVLTGYGDGVPQRTGPAYVDPIGALNGAMAVLLPSAWPGSSGAPRRR
jgi:hypothetical protein